MKLTSPSLSLSFPTFAAIAPAAPSQALGLSITDDSLKIIQLKGRKHTATVDILTSSTIPDGKVIEGEIKDINAIAGILQKTLDPFKKNHAKGVVASLPEPQTFTSVITVPKKEATPIETRLKEILPEYLPYKLNEVYYDTHIIKETDQNWIILIGAAPQKIVNDYLSVMDQARLIPLALDIEALAITNALIPWEETEQKTRAIVNLGRRRASMIIHDLGATQFTISLPISGAEVTKKIMTTLDITASQAEKTKQACGLHPEKCEGVLRKILEEMVQHLIEKIIDGRQYYKEHFPENRDIEEIILSGGGAHLYALDKVLSEALEIPVRLGNLWENVNLTKPPKLESELRYATTAGLASRALNGKNII